MAEKRKDAKSAYDVPIKRPFEELPEWFARTLNSRYTTKREKKPAQGAYSEGSRRSAGQRDQRSEQ